MSTEQSSIKARVETVTPEFAANILKSKNPRNRSISNSRVAGYAADMARGHWPVNGEPIILDEDGNLIDGQHRLAAIVMCGKSIQLLVVRGVPKEYKNGLMILTQDTIDRGSVRGVGQQLQMAHGFKNGNNVATTARGVAQFLTGDHAIKLSTCQTLEVLKLYGRSIESVLAMIPITRLRIGAVMTVLSLFHSIEPARSEDFIIKFVTLENLPAKHPALALHRWISENATGNGADRARTMKVSNSAVYHFHHGNSASKLYPSEEAYNWMLAQHKANARKIQAIAIQKFNEAA